MKYKTSSVKYKYSTYHDHDTSTPNTSKMETDCQVCSNIHDEQEWREDINTVLVLAIHVTLHSFTGTTQVYLYRPLKIVSRDRRNMSHLLCMTCSYLKWWSSSCQPGVRWPRLGSTIIMGEFSFTSTHLHLYIQGNITRWSWSEIKARM